MTAMVCWLMVSRCRALKCTFVAYFTFFMLIGLVFYFNEFLSLSPNVEYTYQQNDDNTPWRCTRMTSSGLGDRLLSYFAIAALAHRFNKTVYLKWDISGDYDLRVYSLPQILRLFNFPATMVFIPSDKFDELTSSFKEIEFDDSELPPYECMYDLLSSFALRVLRIPGKSSMAKNYVDHESYLASYQTIGRQFSYKSKISPTIGFYILFHYRNGDKLTQEKDRILSQRNDPIKSKLYCTHEILQAIENIPSLKVIMVSDDPKLANDLLNQYPFITPSYYYYPANHDNTKLANESMDLTLALNAVAIIQHSPLGWSSFSAAASLAVGPERQGAVAGAVSAIAGASIAVPPVIAILLYQRWWTAPFVLAAAGAAWVVLAGWRRR